MKTNNLLLAIAGLILCITACKKTELAVTPSDTSADVYVAGTIIAGNGNFVAAYWKNGAIVKLTDSLVPSSANAIAVNGSDVYVAGTMSTPEDSITPTNPGATRAVLWKNGVAKTLNSNGLINCVPSALAFQGNDLYIVGYANNNTYPSTAMYWKNTVLTALPNVSGNSNARALAVSGTDVYVAGYNSAGIVYWKNGGSPVSISLVSSSYDVSSIAVNGADVYLAGSVNNEAAFWKNGIATVAASGGTVSGITTNGPDLLMAGTVIKNVGSGGFATYWKNNVPTQLAPGTGFATAISSNGADVYVAGGTYTVNPANGTSENLLCCYWKNGVPVPLSTAGSMNVDISSMVAVPH
jgi:hypothetical protein